MRTTFDPNHPPFVPGNVPLYYRTLNMSSPQAWGLHYDVHSLFGYTETMGESPFFRHPTTSLFVLFFPPTLIFGGIFNQQLETRSSLSAASELWSSPGPRLLDSKRMGTIGTWDPGWESTLCWSKSSLLKCCSYLCVWEGRRLGDNESTFQSMTLSISGILSMNMFGVQLVGADICGFNGELVFCG